MYTLKRNNVIKQTESESKRDALLDRGYTLVETSESETAGGRKKKDDPEKTEPPK